MNLLNMERTGNRLSGFYGLLLSFQPLKADSHKNQEFMEVFLFAHLEQLAIVHRPLTISIMQVYASAL